MLISVILSRPQGHSAARTNTSMKNYDTTGIKPANFRLVALCLNRLRHLVSQSVLLIYLQYQRVKYVTNCCGCPKTGNINVWNTCSLRHDNKQTFGGNYRVSERQEYVWQACSIMSLEIIRIFGVCVTVHH